MYNECYFIFKVDLTNIKPFMWNGTNYLLKMTSGSGDAAFLSAFDEVASWLGFAPHEMNPFLVPTELYNEVSILFSVHIFVWSLHNRWIYRNLR
jgi:hypothetical protein